MSERRGNEKPIKIPGVDPDDEEQFEDVLRDLLATGPHVEPLSHVDHVAWWNPAPFGCFFDGEAEMAAGQDQPRTEGVRWYPCCCCHSVDIACGKRKCLANL